ncbi:ribonuclease P protein subunit p25-like protein [Pseudomyrmex gracilis]|uniref:ribonuclease P protein subunit p25-like protein n=1 Tax=Pseudomyrmex gracilis TaxID=219809 RepID=UPI000994C28C|nr:ribonuclease P protein subunit p25-like protein [Pseudomyrmex gracilis]
MGLPIQHPQPTISFSLCLTLGANAFSIAMGRSKLKKRVKQEISTKELAEDITETMKNTQVPIEDLPEKFLWMHVKSGTKIRNVLGYALKEFPNHDSIVWTGTGHGMGKAISCAELFKKKHEGLRQVTKLCYAKSKELKENASKDTQRIPEIHILLKKENIKDTSSKEVQTKQKRKLNDNTNSPSKKNKKKKT